MSDRSNNTNNFFHLFVNWFGLAITLIGLLILMLLTMLDPSSSESVWLMVSKELGIALIGAGVVTLLLRWQLERQLEGNLVNTINTSVLDGVQQFGTLLKKEIKGRGDFDPAVIYTDRFRAYDKLEKDIRGLLRDKGTLNYTSLGISGQYVFFRLRDDAGIPSRCTIRVLMADPRLLDERIIPKINEVRRRLSACTDQLIRIADERSLDLEILYISPTPALRIDIFDTDTFLYAFDDQHRPEGSLPDAARFGQGTQWDRTSRQMADDAARMARAGWRRGDPPWVILNGNAVREPIVSDSGLDGQIRGLLHRLGLPMLPEGEIRKLMDSLAKINVEGIVKSIN